MEHDPSLFTQLSIVLVIVTVVSLIMRLFKQPLIMGYILTGILVGPVFLDLITNKEALEGFAEIGITLLLLIIGLGLNAAVIKSLGRVATITAATILVLVGSLGFLASAALGFTTTDGLVIGLALFFSSTIIILKVLTDRKEVTRLYGQIAIGVILVDDIVATIAILVVAAIGTSGGLNGLDVVLLIGKGLLVGATLALLAIKVLPWATKLFANSQELLFLFTVAWGFGIAITFEAIGFSKEVGALFAGVTLAGLPYATEMSSRLKPLRDFFIILFFINLGETFTFSNMSSALVPALVLSAIVSFGKPLFVMSALGFLGYTRLTSFKAGIHLSQISEFSIILVVFATSLGLVSPEVSAVITLVALITIGTSTYMMKYDDALYGLIGDHLKMFEGRVIYSDKRKVEHYQLVLFGYRKGGHEFVRTFREMKKRFIVVDYDPEVIEHMEHQGVPYAYGDATDPELLEEINIDKAELIVSTMTDMPTNRALLQDVRRHNQKAVFISHADNYDEAADLYNHGATYVMLPHFIGSERISSFIKRHGASRGAFDEYREKHLMNLGRTALKD
jgi:Kef-type K+ transport system membrane component KefB